MVVAVAIIHTEQFHPLLIATTQPRSQALGKWGEEKMNKNTRHSSPQLRMRLGLNDARVELASFPGFLRLQFLIAYRSRRSGNEASE